MDHGILDHLGDVDEPIRDLVKILNENGYPTQASCCGHGFRPATIILKDERWIIIARDREEAMRINDIFPLTIHGEPRALPEGFLTPEEQREGTKWTDRAGAFAQDNWALLRAIGIFALKARGKHDGRDTFNLTYFHSNIADLLAEHDSKNEERISKEVVALAGKWNRASDACRRIAKWRDLLMDKQTNIRYKKDVCEVNHDGT